MSAANPTTGILWIASFPKSGNTWTRTFLHNLFRQIDGDDREYDINKINEFTTWDLSAKAYEEIIGKHPKDVDRAEIARVRPQVQANIAANTKGLALVKTHHAMMTDRGVPAINPAVTSGAIYIVRNPLDVAISFAAHLSTASIPPSTRWRRKASKRTSLTGAFTRCMAPGARTLQLDTQAAPGAALMRYEDMLENPFEAFSRLATHLLLRPTTAQLLEAVDRSSFERLQKQEKELGFREKPEAAERFFREGREGQWREQLSRRQIRRIVSQHSEQMRRFGYLTEELAHLA